MHDCASREIETWESAPEKGVQKTSFPPHHVCHWEVDQQRPEHHEQEHCLELHAFCESTSDQRGGDHRKHKLVDHEGLVRNGRSVVCIGRAVHAPQEQITQVTDEGSTLAKGKAVADYSP